MKGLFNLTSALLCISGLLHLMKVFAYPVDPNAMVAVVLTALFGLVYLAIGILLFRNKSDDRLIWAGAVAPLVGLVLTLIGMRPNPDFFITAFIVLDVLVIGLCAFLLYKGRSPIGRVR
jgi:hypothetical protein